MSSMRAYASLLALERPILTTAEVSSRLGIARSSATRLLHRLTRVGLAARIRRGIWALSKRIPPYQIAEYLTAPYPSYVSMWTALREHGLLSQIPNIIYVVSLDRSKKIATSLGTFEIHHIDPRLFGGFEHHDLVPIAKPEKALFDTIYLLATRGERSMKLPELEFPKDFDRDEVFRWVDKISSGRRRSFTRRHIERILDRADAIA